MNNPHIRDHRNRLKRELKAYQKRLNALLETADDLENVTIFSGSLKSLLKQRANLGRLARKLENAKRNASVKHGV